jgi:hypothetical protein
MPARWTVGQPSYDPGRPGWSISAVGPNRGREKLPTFVSGFGENEPAAVRDLDARLRGEWSDGPRRLDELTARIRLAYVQGAEAWTRDALGRSLSSSQLEGVLRRSQLRRSAAGRDPRRTRARGREKLQDDPTRRSAQSMTASVRDAVDYRPTPRRTMPHSG